jgi:type IV pilus assembly protein PilO
MNSKLRTIIFFVVLLGLSYVSYQYMINPANQTLNALRVKIDEKTAKLAELDKATAAAKDMSKQLEQLEEAIKFFEGKLPPHSEIHKVLEQITVIAQKEGLQPKTISTLAQKNNSGYIEQPLKMQLKGNFTSFYAFMLEIEQLPRIMKIRELKLTKEKDDDGQVTADFVISIFFQNKNA